MPASPSTPRRSPLVRLALVMAVFLVAVLALSMWAAWQAPAWYAPRPLGDSDAALAERVERRVLSELSAAHRFGEPWTLSITAAEAQAWMNVRLPVWLENHNVPRPPWFGFVALDFEDGQARAGLGTGAGGKPPVISISIDPPKAAGALPEHSVKLGILPVPAWLIEKIAPGLTKQLEQATKPTAQSPEQTGMGTIRLDDGRRVRFTGFDAIKGTLTLRSVTLGKP